MARQSLCFRAARRGGTVRGFFLRETHSPSTSPSERRDAATAGAGAGAGAGASPSSGAAGATPAFEARRAPAMPAFDPRRRIPAFEPRRSPPPIEFRRSVIPLIALISPLPLLIEERRRACVALESACSRAQLHNEQLWAIKRATQPREHTVGSLSVATPSSRACTRENRSLERSPLCAISVRDNARSGRGAHAERG